MWVAVTAAFVLAILWVAIVFRLARRRDKALVAALDELNSALEHQDATLDALVRSASKLEAARRPVSKSDGHRANDHAEASSLSEIDSPSGFVGRRQRFDQLWRAALARAFEVEQTGHHHLRSRYSLSPREREILQLMVEGASDASIITMLNVKAIKYLAYGQTDLAVGDAAKGFYVEKGLGHELPAFHRDIRGENRLMVYVTRGYSGYPKWAPGWAVRRTFFRTLADEKPLGLAVGTWDPKLADLAAIEPQRSS